MQMNRAFLPGYLGFDVDCATQVEQLVNERHYECFFVELVCVVHARLLGFLWLGISFQAMGFAW
jgi:hypothetical protein